MVVLESLLPDFFDFLFFFGFLVPVVSGELLSVVELPDLAPLFELSVCPAPLPAP